MKKAFTMCLCFVLLLTLVSCSNDTNSTDSEIECSNCGAAIAEEAKFCSSCGTLVTPFARSSATERNRVDVN